jgi:hypothetical protein
MRMWAPIWSGIVDSTIWEEKDHVFRVFIGMLAIKDYDHVVRYDAYKLARRLHLSLDLILDAIRVLSSSDDRRPGQPFDGRRIQLHPEGWLVLNGEKYAELTRVEMRRRRWRKAQEKRRKLTKQKASSGYDARSMHDAPSPSI